MAKRRSIVKKNTPRITVPFPKVGYWYWFATPARNKLQVGRVWAKRKWGVIFVQNGQFIYVELCYLRERRDEMPALMRKNRKVQDYRERTAVPRYKQPLPTDVDNNRELLMRINWTWWAVETKGDIPWPCVYVRNHDRHSYDLVALGIFRPFLPEFVGFLYTDALKYSFGDDYNALVHFEENPLPDTATMPPVALLGAVAV